MGNRSYLSHGCHITLNSKVTIEDNATVGPFVKIFTDSHTFENPKRRFGKMISRPVTIKEGAFIGAGAIILQGVTIGEGAIVGAGTVVAKDVPPQTTVIGNPMKNLGPVRNAGEQQETPVTPINAAAGLS
jgi:maltose O-acetyltransferase